MRRAERTKMAAIRFPESVVRDLERHVRRGKRGDFIVKATQRALLELKQTLALKEYRGTLSAEDYPEFRTPQDTREWVNKVCSESDKRLERRRGHNIG